MVSGRAYGNIQKDFNDYPRYLFLNFNRENCKLTTTHRPLLNHTDKIPSSPATGKKDAIKNNKFDPI